MTYDMDSSFNSSGQRFSLGNFGDRSFSGQIEPFSVRGSTFSNGGGLRSNFNKKTFFKLSSFRGLPSNIENNFEKPTAKMSIRNLNRRKTTFQEREAARKEAILTFQPKKRKIIRYFASRKDLLKPDLIFSTKEEPKEDDYLRTTGATNETEAQENENEVILNFSRSSFNSAESVKDDDDDEKSEKSIKLKNKEKIMHVVYDLGNVFAFNTANEETLRKSAKKLGFDIYEMQRNRIENDSEFALVTILYERGVESLLPSIRKELALTIMKTSFISIEKKVDKKLSIDNKFTSNIINDSTLVIYWVNSVKRNDNIENNVDSLQDLRPEGFDFFWELVLFSPDNTLSDNNDLGVKKFKVTSYKDIKDCKYKIFGTTDRLTKVFTMAELQEKFENYHN